jgi:hypothetical protein
MVDQEGSHQMAADGIAIPNSNDILLGRGSRYNDHVGNQHYLRMVKHLKRAYVMCPKQKKGTYPLLIVKTIKRMSPPGRFLRYDSVSMLWYEVSFKKSVNRTRQSLRDGAPKIMKKIEEEEEEGSSVQEEVEAENEEHDARYTSSDQTAHHAVRCTSMQRKHTIVNAEHQDFVHSDIQLNSLNLLHQHSDARRLRRLNNYSLLEHGHLPHVVGRGLPSRQEYQNSRPMWLGGAGGGADWRNVHQETARSSVLRIALVQAKIAEEHARIILIRAKMQKEIKDHTKGNMPTVTRCKPWQS